LAQPQHLNNRITTPPQPARRQPRLNPAPPATVRHVENTGLPIPVSQNLTTRQTRQILTLFQESMPKLAKSAGSGHHRRALDKNGQMADKNGHIAYKKRTYSPNYVRPQRPKYSPSTRERHPILDKNGQIRTYFTNFKDCIFQGREQRPHPQRKENPIPLPPVMLVTLLTKYRQERKPHAGIPAMRALQV
jgi:hypothetical protein